MVSEKMKNPLIILILAFILIAVWPKTKDTGAAISAENFVISDDTTKNVNAYDAIISGASVSFGISSARIKAHIAVESNGDENAVGSAGEIGLMQITQAALTDVNNKYYSNSPFTLQQVQDIPSVSIHTGVAYLKILVDQFGNMDKASMAYKGGAGALVSKATAANTYLSKIKIAEAKF
jgi:soluble lytic murein transglycosylase-like protein